MTHFEATTLWDKLGISQLSSVYPHLQHLSMYGSCAFRLDFKEPKAKIIKFICESFKSLRALTVENLLGFEEAFLERRDKSYEIDSGEAGDRYAMEAMKALSQVCWLCSQSTCLC